MVQGKKLSVYLPLGIAAQARGASLSLGMPLSHIVALALERHLRTLAKRHNDGRPFAAPRGNLRTGRRLSVD